MSVSTSTEVELKYAVRDGVAMPDLAVAPGIASAEAQPDAHLEAVYVDTADRALLAARIAVRRRTGGHDAGWHVKLAAEAGRIELHAPVDVHDPDRLPDAFERLLRSRVRGRALQPIARIVTERRGVLVTTDDGGRVEVVDDAVHAVDVDADRERTWREWEAERVGDAARDDAALARVDALLLAAGATRSASPAKLAQALGGGWTASPRPRRAGGHLAAMVAPLAEELHRRLLGLLVHGDPDGSAVHGLRRTIRRLRSLLSLRPVAGPRGDDLRERLGALATALGEARDPLVAADAAEALLRRVSDDLPGLTDVRAELIDGPRGRVEALTASAVEAMLAPEALEAYALLDRFVAEGPDGPRAGEPKRLLEALAEQEVRRARRKARKADDHDLEALHDVRKAAKRARMVVEELSSAGLLRREGLLRTARRANGVQEALGAHRDLALLLARLPEASRRISERGGNAYALGRLSARGDRRLGGLLAVARRSLRRLRG